MKKLAIVGCGKLAEIVVDALIGGLLPGYQLMGTLSRSEGKAKYLAEKITNSNCGYTCTPCRTTAELLALKPDYIVESASPAAMKELVLPALENGSSVVTLSIGAFADRPFYEKVMETARKNNSRVHLVSGAIGGFDLMRTASLMGNCTASFDTEKGPNSLKGTSIYNDSLQSEKQVVFKGSAKKAIELFPTKVNVAVAAALASVGPEEIKMTMTSTPGFIGDRHRIEVKNEQVHGVVDVYSSTARIAGWSVVNALQNIASPIVF